MLADVVIDRQATVAQPAAKAFSTLVHETVEAMQKYLQLAQAHMVAQASKYHRDVQFAIYDQVLLDIRNLNLMGSKKFKACFVGPF